MCVFDQGCEWNCRWIGEWVGAVVGGWVADLVNTLSGHHTGVHCGLQQALLLMPLDQCVDTVLCVKPPSLQKPHLVCQCLQLAAQCS